MIKTGVMTVPTENSEKTSFKSTEGTKGLWGRWNGTRKRREGT